MDYSSQQHEALEQIQQWIKAKQTQTFRLFGYAGTGKTTIAKEVAKMVSSSVFCAFTGKAVSVLASKGCHNAHTIHSLIYTYVPKGVDRYKELSDHLDIAKKEGKPFSFLEKIEAQMRQEKININKPFFRWNEDSDVRNVQLIIVDEVSMVDEIMGKDLEAYGIPILVLGDPAQLPPVKGCGYFTNQKPDYLLTEVHRQARDNPVLELATRVREGKELSLGQYGQSCVISPNERELIKEHSLKSDQILVGMNKTRHAINARMRELNGFAGDFPQKDEKIICLKNNRDIGLLNGELFYVNSSQSDGKEVILDVYNDTKKISCTAWPEIFVGQDLPIFDQALHEQFDYGYAITVHKSQGSQWENVVIFDEWKIPASRKEWLYTAITRAANQVTIVKK